MVSLMQVIDIDIVEKKVMNAAPKPACMFFCDLDRIFIFHVWNMIMNDDW